MHTMSGDSNLKTLLIGIDAACHRVLNPLFERGELPTLSSVFESGVSSPLESQIPPWTASAWPSLYTGMNPGKHGVFSFLSFDGYDWDVVNSTDVRERTLWGVLSHHGVSSVVVNVPVTHPPRPFDGALIPGYTAPENPECHPNGLLDDVRTEIGEYHVYPDTDDGELVDSYRACIRSRTAAFEYLVARFEPEFGFVQFQATDSVVHRRPGDQNAVRSVYGEVDKQVGELIATTDPDNVVIVSDHGIGPYDGYEFRVNDFLYDTGYVEFETDGRGMPSWGIARDSKLKKGEADTSLSQGLAEQFVASVASFGISSQSVGAALERIGILDPIAKHVPLMLVKAGENWVSLPRSEAYMRSRIELGVRINLEGRDPDGVVAQSEYESVRQRLIERLRSVRTPDGEFVFEEVRRREAYFHGPESDRAVDVVTIPSNFNHFLSAKHRGKQFGPPMEPWDHKLHGIIAAVGSDIQTGVTLEDPHLLDVAPTVLATLGIPMDERMDGESLSCVEPVGATTLSRFNGSPSVTTDDERIEDRLTDLGYLE